MPEYSLINIGALTKPVTVLIEKSFYRSWDFVGT